jgi:ATP-binding cassette, subfamily B (MDR/TAP), member 1
MKLVISGTSVQDIVQVFTMLIFTLANLSHILQNIPQIGSTKDTASRLLRLAELPTDSYERLGDTRVTRIGDIIFEDLEFSYPSRPDQMVLKGISLHIHSGTSTAIVGGSGSGKSTIANLLLKMYGIPRTSTGELIMGGRGINHIDTACLRLLVTPVLQSPVLFSATIAENIAYGLASSSEQMSTAAVHSAAKQAGIHNFIISLPQGYGTMVGDGGLGLSGGQAQRVAIARALIRKPAVLILDEATSALDVDSAELVRDTILRLVRDPSNAMTVIIISHTREMMEIADHVVVLDQGRIVEEGEFEELMAKEGALANLLSGGEWVGETQYADRRVRGVRVPLMKNADWQKKSRKRQPRQR